MGGAGDVTAQLDSPRFVAPRSQTSASVPLDSFDWDLDSSTASPSTGERMPGSLPPASTTPVKTETSTTSASSAVKPSPARGKSSTSSASSHATGITPLNASAPIVDSVLKIKVVDAHGAAIWIRGKRSLKLSKVLAVYATRLQKDAKRLALSYQGVPVRTSDTLYSLRVKDEDVLVVAESKSDAKRQSPCMPSERERQRPPATSPAPPPEPSARERESDAAPAGQQSSPASELKGSSSDDEDSDGLVTPEAQSESGEPQGDLDLLFAKDARLPAELADQAAARGRFFLRHSSFLLAVQHFSRALTHDPWNPCHFCARARAYTALWTQLAVERALEDWLSARRYYKRQGVSPPPIEVQLGLLRAQVSLSKVVDARKTLHTIDKIRASLETPMLVELAQLELQLAVAPPAMNGNAA